MKKRFNLLPLVGRKLILQPHLCLSELLIKFNLIQQIIEKHLQSFLLILLIFLFFKSLYAEPRSFVKRKRVVVRGLLFVIDIIEEIS